MKIRDTLIKSIAHGISNQCRVKGVTMAKECSESEVTYNSRKHDFLPNMIGSK
ncbi:MAG: hypothetical protein OXC30_00135 [Alphaproteobacteria bacterium]|nr:hypothetical protein [Alphaproteobacteria bacterium]